MKKSLCVIAAFMVVGLSACGGGGGGSSDTATSPVVTAPVSPVNPVSPVSSYACDATTSAATALHTGAYIATYEPPLLPPIGNTRTVDRWTVQIDGQSYDLNVVISRPPATTGVRGIVVNVHGFSALNATMSPIAMTTTVWEEQMNQRGYWSVSVALRGNFGSTGDGLLDVAANGMLAQYQAKQISYADLQLASMKYQAASVVAVLKKMSLDPVYQPYMSTIMLVGASGGANTVIQTAADSPVFQAATKKALVRLTGLDSAGDTNPDAGPGVSEYTARIAKNTVSSLWIAGEADTTTSVGQLACQFKFFDQASGFSNFFYVVPGFGHGISADLFTPTIEPVFKQYMTSRGFGGF